MLSFHSVCFNTSPLEMQYSFFLSGESEYLLFIIFFLKRNELKHRLLSSPNNKHLLFQSPFLQTTLGVNVSQACWNVNLNKMGKICWPLFPWEASVALGWQMSPTFSSRCLIRKNWQGST